MTPRGPSFRPRVRRDAHEVLIAALAPHLPPDTRLLTSRRTAWASVTFVGARHELSYTAAADRPKLAQLLAELADIEFTLAGHFVAEIRGEMRADELLIEVLTVED